MRFREDQKDDYLLSANPALLQINVIHDYLSKDSYWAKGIPLEICKRSVKNSLCFGLYHHGKQVGFARIITDYATIAYLGDVFILKEHQGKGLSKWMMNFIMSYPDLQGLRRWILGTRDAHGLYSQFGFTGIQKPERFMEKGDPDPYGMNDLI